MAITTSGTSITFNDSTTQTSAAVTSANVQNFTSSGTWTKPTGLYTMARIQMWGGGGGGGRGSSSAAGGGGGEYAEITVPISYLASTVTATVGSGGAGATVTGSGGNGGQSSFALSTAWVGVSTLTAAGGLGGGSSGSSGGNGGSFARIVSISQNIGACSTVGDYLGRGIGSGPTDYSQATGNIFGGAGGSYVYTAGHSVYGGGGGGNGLSKYGGNGSAFAVNPSAGVQPAGGGAASNSGNTNGAAGAAGQIIVTCW